jgi:hypothetical protein
MIVYRIYFELNLENITEHKHARKKKLKEVKWIRIQACLAFVGDVLDVIALDARTHEAHGDRSIDVLLDAVAALGGSALGADDRHGGDHLALDRRILRERRHEAVIETAKDDVRPRLVRDGALLFLKQGLGETDLTRLRQRTYLGKNGPKGGVLVRLGIIALLVVGAIVGKKRRRDGLHDMQPRVVSLTSEMYGHLCTQHATFKGCTRADLTLQMHECILVYVTQDPA